VNLEPPSGSRISITTDGAYPLIVVPHRSNGPMRFFHGLFLLVWLGGWFAGFRAVFARVESEKRRIPRDLRMRESTALIRFGGGNDAETVFDGPA
jgi:hypothetical protein